MLKKDPLKQKRIFVGFNSAGAAGIYAFTRILRRRGYQIDFYGIGKTHFDMPVDFLLEFSSHPLKSLFQRISYFFKILPRYDLWHLNYAEAFFFYPLNLFILKLFRKKIVLTFRGIDIQTDLEFLTENIYSKSRSDNWPEYYRLHFSVNSWSRLLKKIRRHIFVYFADKIVLTGPFLAGQVTRYDKIIPYARDIEKKDDFSLRKKAKKITILHIPSDPVVKGTAEISRVFNKLGKKFPEHSFRVLPSLPREKLLDEMAKADIIVDQIIIGWYGGQAVEAMAQGKIVMAFLNPSYLQLVSFGREIPIWNTNFWSLEKDLRVLIKVFPEIQREWREKSSQFVKKYHDSRKIANEYLTVYRETYE